MVEKKSYHADTNNAQPPEPAASVSRPLVPPIDLASVSIIKDLDEVDALYEGRRPGYFYSRDGNANADQLAAKIALLEGAEAALICASGMAAIAAVLLAELSGGDHVAISEGLYGKTARLAEDQLPRFGIGCSSFDVTVPETLEQALAPTTRVVLIETISNPLVRVADIAKLAAITHRHGALLVVDHTFAPLLCEPLALGADLVVHSLTKLIGGHSDALLGAVAGGRERIRKQQAIASTFGLTAASLDSWLVLRGMATLSVRSDRACASALWLAAKLERHGKVRKVHYPGLASSPDHTLARRQFERGFGTIVTIDVGGRTEADALIKNLKLIPFAPSLGDVSSTLSYPAGTSHRGQSAEKWARQGITPGLVRFSIGLEHPQDLWADLEAGLAAIPG